MPHQLIMSQAQVENYHALLKRTEERDTALRDGTPLDCVGCGDPLFVELNIRRELCRPCALKRGAPACEKCGEAMRHHWTHYPDGGAWMDDPFGDDGPAPEPCGEEYQCPACRHRFVEGERS